MFKTIQHIHFVGIGGAGMSGISEVLLNLGYQVSGSDLKESEVTTRLASLGAKIFYGHREANVGNAQVVVTSTAVQSANPEVIYARKNKIPVIPRIEMLAELARLKYTIAVAGTHGKTTTTSLVANILQESGLDPTFIVGGKLNKFQSGAKLGSGDYLVAEADESDGSFLKLSPTFGIITNIDNDHLDYYKSMNNLRKSFIEFGNHIPFYGAMIVCMEDPEVRGIFPSLKRRVITYGFSEKYDYSASDIRSSAHYTKFTLHYLGKPVGDVELKLAGRHNVLNCLAAIACASQLKVPFDITTRSLKNFENAQRRLEVRGEKEGGIWVDDYGHHPTEIKATISALRERYPDRKAIVLFQPHRYTRTQKLFKDFLKCFDQADELILLPIYPASEKPIPGVTSDKLAASLKKKGKTVSLIKGVIESREIELLKKYQNKENVFLTLGAGDVWKVGEKLFGAQKSKFEFKVIKT